jgi:hypothetical protein
MSPSETVFLAFEKKLREDPEFRKKLGEGISASLERAGLEAAPTETTAESLRLGETLAVAAGQVITAQAFWWGYQFVIPESTMKGFSNAGNAVMAFMSLGGSVIAASGGALAPAVAIAAAYVAAELALMQVVDQGKGVYLSASWLKPDLIVPTAIT